MRIGFFLLIVCSFLLSACQKKLTQNYLFTHPSVLKAELNNCYARDNKSNEQITYCEMVEKTANEFSALLIEQQQAPEKFGQRIMQAQTNCLEAKDALKKAKGTLAKLSKNDSTFADSQSSFQAGLQLKEKTCQEVKNLLAVMSLSSPE